MWLLASGAFIADIVVMVYGRIVSVNFDMDLLEIDCGVGVPVLRRKSDILQSYHGAKIMYDQAKNKKEIYVIKHYFCDC